MIKMGPTPGAEITPHAIAAGETLPMVNPGDSTYSLRCGYL